jgi:hypothetical protein
MSEPPYQVACRKCGTPYWYMCPVCSRSADSKRAVGKDSLLFESGALIDLLARHQDPAFRELARYVRAGVDYELSLYFAADLIRSIQPPDTPPP